MSLFELIKIRFLSFFRDIFVYHTNSLEFRAKIIASVVAIRNSINKCEEEHLYKLAYKTYKNDDARAKILIQITKEYISKIIEKNELDINSLIKNIDDTIKKSKKLVYKINIKELKKFLNCTENDEEIHIIQKRIIEFLQSEIREYSKSK